jgi:hypothetical protein
VKIQNSKIAGRLNYRKIAVVVFITVLIWVWADLALDEMLSDRPATIMVDEAASPKLWVSLNQAPSVDIRITLSGPPAAITEERKKLKAGKRFEFDFDAGQEKMDEPGHYTLTLLPYLQKNKQIRRLGLKTQSCDPEKLSVDVVELVKKPLVVNCVDEEQMPVKTAAIEPAQVEMYVPVDWTAEKLNAKVLLTKREIAQARLAPIKKSPYIELAANYKRESQLPVLVKTPPRQDQLRDYTITTATLGFTFSPNLQGKYKVEVTNLNEVIRAITIRATPDAKRAYDEMRYQVILEIDDADKDTALEKPLRKQLIYNFPPEYIRKDEIILIQQPVMARFKLILLADQTPPTTTE